MKNETGKAKSKKGISYIRYSTLIQGEGDSERRQSDDTTKFLETHGIELLPDGKYADFGISGFQGANLEHGALGVIVDKVQQGKIPKDTYLVIESLDRLSRAPVDKQVELFMNILSGGINIATVDPPQIYTHFGSPDYDAHRFFMELMIALTVMQRAWEESDRKRNRISKARSVGRQFAREKKKVMTAMAPAWVKLVDGKFELVEERVKVVKEIFRLATKEGLGSYAIASNLNKSGEEPWGGKARNKSGLWGKTMITRILTDRRVIGEFQPMTKMTLKKVSSEKEIWEKGERKKAGEPIEGYYPKIIDESLFYKVSGIRAERGATGGGRRVRSGKMNVFKGIAKCFCGAPLHLKDGNKTGETKYLYLTCSVGCGLKSTQYSQVERVFSILCKISREELEVVEQREDWRKEKDSKLIALEGSIDSKESLIDNLTDRLKDNHADDMEDIVNLIRTTRNEIKGLQKKKEILSKLATPTNEEMSMEAMFAEADKKEQPLSEEEFTRVLKLRYKKIEVRSLKLGKFGQRIEFIEKLKDGSEIFNVAEFDPRREVDILLGWNSNGLIKFDEWVEKPDADRSFLLRDSRPEGE